MNSHKFHSHQLSRARARCLSFNVKKSVEKEIGMEGSERYGENGSDV